MFLLRIVRKEEFYRVKIDCREIPLNNDRDESISASEGNLVYEGYKNIFFTIVVNERFYF